MVVDSGHVVRSKSFIASDLGGLRQPPPLEGVEIWQRLWLRLGVNIDGYC